MGIVDTLAFLAFASVLVLWVRSKSRKTVNLPPGPKPVPVLGNVRDLTAKELWLPATEWARQYGDVVYLHVVGVGLVFLNSYEAASDLLDTKGSIYSDKPSLLMAGELCGCKNMVAFTGYGETSRRQRKLFKTAFGPSSIPAYHPLIESETNTLLRRLLANPSDYLSIVRRYAGGLTLQVIYGYRASEDGPDEFLDLAEDCVDILSNQIASGGGIWPVDIFPSLQKLPDWMPGAGFKTKARVWKAKMEEFTEKPYAFLKRNYDAGTYVPSFCSSILESSKTLSPEAEFDLKWTANSMYSASGDTTITSVSHFLHAIMKHPEVLRKAQAEIDSVTGGERLPGFEDREELKYVEAVMSEVLRFGAPVPLNLPHRLMEDDVYKGMVIPKGSLVFGNIWAMTRDEKVFPDADTFDPERYMQQHDEETMRRMDPRRYVFGFGRRACPGRDLVESSIWLLFARMLATLEIGIPVDEQGRKVEPKVEFCNSVFRSMTPFEVDIRPRSEGAVRLVRGGL